MRHLPVLIVQGALLCGAVCWTAAQREHGHDLLLPPFRVSSPATLILDDIVASTWQQSIPSTIHVTAGPGYKSYRTTGGFGHYTASDMRHLPVLIVQGALLCGAVCWTAAQREHGHDLLLPPFRVSSPATLILDDIVASTWQQSIPSTIHVTAGPGYKSYRTTGGFGHYTASDMRHLPVLIVQHAFLTALLIRNKSHAHVPELPTSPPHLSHSLPKTGTAFLLTLPPLPTCPCSKKV
nr:uncharacterized protein LOC119187008 [Rhipicephalus microplus]